MIKLGLIAYASDTGLGNQTLEFYRHMQPHKTLVIDLSAHNHMPVKLERFPDGRIIRGLPTEYDIEWLTEDVRAIFVCETPLNFQLFDKARSKGVVTIQQYNYEFLDYFLYPDWPKPTILAAPTKWNIDRVRHLEIAPVYEWPVPVNRLEIPFREIKECKTFVHVIGRPAVHDRNGTISFLEAAEKVGNRAKYKIFLQPPTDYKAMEYFQPVKEVIDRYRGTLNLEIIENVANYRDIYQAGDVMVLPRRYGGLCLPMNEALSAGMPVIMTDISPNADILPKEWLVPARMVKQFQPRPLVDVFMADVNMLAYRMLEFYNSTDYMIAANQKANEIAEQMSWETLKPRYDELLREVWT